MIYLMCPYTKQSPTHQDLYADLAAAAAGCLMMLRPHEFVFSPITHGHQIAPTLPKRVAQDHAFWMNQCANTLKHVDTIYLLPLPGWVESKGVAMETEWAKECGRQVTVLGNLQVLINRIPWSSDAVFKILRYLDNIDRLLPVEQQALTGIYGPQRLDLDTGELYIQPMPNHPVSTWSPK